MFARALVATDLSPASQSMINGANKLSSLGVKEIVLLHCFSANDMTGVSFANGGAELDVLLQKQADQLQSLGFQTSTRTCTGNPQHGVKDVAKDCACDLVVIGSHGHAIRSGMHLGGRAWGIIHNSVLPVLVMRLVAHEKEGVKLADETANLLERVMLATDFSPQAEAAVPYVGEMVRKGARDILLVHVQDAAVIDPYLMDKREEFDLFDRQQLEDTQRKIFDKSGIDESRKSSIQVNIDIRYGKPSMELLEAESDFNPSIIVMGTHGKGFVKEIFMGSVSHAVTRHAKTVMLLIPQK